MLNYFARHFGDRPDGWRVRKVNDVNCLVPYIMRTRLDSQNHFVHRAAAIPHHVHCGGCAAVFLDNHLHAVGECGLVRIGQGGQWSRERAAKEEGAGKRLEKHGDVLHLLEFAALRGGRCTVHQSNGEPHINAIGHGCPRLA